MQAVLLFLQANFLNVAVSILIIDRALERIFPNAKILAKFDEILSNLGVKAN